MVFRLSARPLEGFLVAGPTPSLSIVVDVPLISTVLQVDSYFSLSRGAQGPLISVVKTSAVSRDFVLSCLPSAVATSQVLDVEFYPPLRSGTGKGWTIRLGVFSWQGLVSTFHLFRRTRRNFSRIPQLGSLGQEFSPYLARARNFYERGLSPQFLC